MTKARDLADLGNGVTEADIAASNSATNGYMLTAQSGNTGGLTWAEAPSSFAPVAVTGTTPSLNVGSYNYFSGATFNADTTISFASVPTNARWTYSAPIVAESGYNLEGAVKDSSSAYVGAQGATPTDIAFSTDGIYMYIMHDAGNNVSQYTLSTALDVSTAVHTRNFDVSSQDTSMTGVEFSTDGIYMYTCGTISDSIWQYTLSTAWNISTATVTRSFDVSADETAPRAIRFKTDGTEMYTIGTDEDVALQYTLSTAWNISTATFTGAFGVNNEESVPLGLAFSSDGLKMFVVGQTTDTVYEYDLGTAWLVTSAVYNQVKRYIGGDDDTPSSQGLTFSADGSKMYLVGHDNDTVDQYSTDGFATITLPAACSHTPTPTYVAGKRITLEFATLNGGTTVDVIQASVG